MVNVLKSVIIAAPSANCGKTELACRLIARMDAPQALKITRFHRESHCPVHGVNDQGQDNCDGCAPAPAGFELVDDPAVLNTPGKDSDRMLKAGADPVLWLRAAPHVFEYALGAAVKRFDSSRPLVIEGNSAATVAGFAGEVVLIWPQVTRGVKASVLPALKRTEKLVLVEAADGSPRRWPTSLKRALSRIGRDENSIREVFWLPAGWWQQPVTAAEMAILNGLMPARSV